MASWPLGDVSEEPVELILPTEHATTRYTNLSDKFRKENVNYNTQYCKLYNVRLEQMRPLIINRVNNKWGTQYPIIKVHKLQESNSKCIVIGTLYKEQKLKPSMLKKISEAYSLISQPIYTNFTDNSDQLFIEDELQRCQIIGFSIDGLVTGITCAFLGTPQDQGKFLVEEFCYADCRSQIERSYISSKNKYICFISGMDLVNFKTNIRHLKLFIDWIDGFLSGECSDDIETTEVSRLIIAGNSIRSEAEIRKQITFVAKVFESDETFKAVDSLDTILYQLVKFLPVDLMPGSHDPSNHLLSQQPMHHCLLPNTGSDSNLNFVPNPYACEIEGVRVLGTSGQPVNDIIAYSKIYNPLEALEQCLVWNHLAPTCPDTLGCYPYYERDPFVIEECPHVFFAGNQPQFETKMHEGPEGQKVRLICIPEFTRSHSVVLLNLRTMNCHELKFENEEM